MILGGCFQTGGFIVVATRFHLDIESSVLGFLLRLYGATRVRIRGLEPHPTTRDAERRAEPYLVREIDFYVPSLSETIKRTSEEAYLVDHFFLPGRQSMQMISRTGPG